MSEDIGWQHAMVDVSGNTEYLIFEAFKPYDDERADIAIDDMFFFF